MNLKNAYLYCRKIALGHYENFPVGSLLFPRESRKYIYSIYSFARTADDIADSDNLSENEKLSGLYEMESKLEQIENGSQAEDEIFFALADTIKTLNIPVKEFKDLLTAFKQDSVKHKYEEFSELLEYSKYSANPVGHLVLYVSGLKDEKLFKLSDNICTALQLANFWQDVSVDLKMHRIYIPNNEMTKYNYDYDKLFDGIQDDNFVNLMKNLVDKTRDIFLKGKELENYLNGRLKYEFRAIYRGGMNILEKIEENNYRVLTGRVKIETQDKFNILFNVFNKL
jgi:hydroxysqualene synthase